MHSSSADFIAVVLRTPGHSCGQVPRTEACEGDHGQLTSLGEVSRANKSDLEAKVVKVMGKPAVDKLVNRIRVEW
jgi:hypothetical protein